MFFHFFYHLNYITFTSKKIQLRYKQIPIYVGQALLFERCDKLQLSGINHINGPGFHLHIVHSRDVTISHIKISAPATTHNTDGIDLTNSVRVNIHDSAIQGGKYITYLYVVSFK